MSLKQIVKHTLKAGVFGVVGLGVGYLGFHLGTGDLSCDHKTKSYENEPKGTEFFRYKDSPPSLSRAIIRIYEGDSEMQFKYSPHINQEKICFGPIGSGETTCYEDIKIDRSVDVIHTFATVRDHTYNSGQENYTTSFKKIKYLEREKDYQEHKQEFDDADKDFAQKRAEVKKYLQSKKFNGVLTKLLKKHDLR